MATLACVGGGAGVYGPMGFWLSSSVPYLPYSVLSALLYSGIMYFMTGLHNTAGRQDQH